MKSLTSGKLNGYLADIDKQTEDMFFRIVKQMAERECVGAGLDMPNDVWIFCPVCKNKTRLKIRKDTEMKNFPLYCPKCKQETVIDVKQLKISVIKEPDA